jgi:glycosyltransferase involved in cell wall biosynthesis
MSEKKIKFLSYRLGYDSLMYWEPVLTEIAKKFKSFEVITAVKSSKSENNNILKITSNIKHFKFFLFKNKINQKLIFIPLPNFIINLIKDPQDVVILNEFNLISFYTIFFKFLYKNTKIILLVESDPYFNKKINRNIFFYLRNLYRKYIVKHVDLILTNNEKGSKYLINHLKAKKEKVIKRPYLTSEIKCDNKNRKNNKVVKCIYVGRLVEGKGVKYLLKAVKKIEKIKNNFELKIIGEGGEKEKLIRFCKDYNLTNVHFLGKVEYKDIKKYYCNSDIFILPTLYDYRALVSFEALTAGLAIVDSCYNGASEEVVKEGTNGYIIDPTNIDVFAERLKEIIVDKNKLNCFKKNSEILSKSYTYERCTSNLLYCIEKVLRERI